MCLALLIWASLKTVKRVTMIDRWPTLSSMFTRVGANWVRLCTKSCPSTYQLSEICVGLKSSQVIFKHYDITCTRSRVHAFTGYSRAMEAKCSTLPAPRASKSAPRKSYLNLTSAPLGCIAGSRQRIANETLKIHGVRDVW